MLTVHTGLSTGRYKTYRAGKLKQGDLYFVCGQGSLRDLKVCCKQNLHWPFDCLSQENQVMREQQVGWLHHSSQESQTTAGWRRVCLIVMDKIRQKETNKAIKHSTFAITVIQIYFLLPDLCGSQQSVFIYMLLQMMRYFKA